MFLGHVIPISTQPITAELFLNLVCPRTTAKLQHRVDCGLKPNRYMWQLTKSSWAQACGHMGHTDVQHDAQTHSQGPVYPLTKRCMDKQNREKNMLSYPKHIPKLIVSYARMNRHKNMCVSTHRLL